MIITSRDSNHLSKFFPCKLRKLSCLFFSIFKRSISRLITSHFLFYQWKVNAIYTYSIWQFCLQHFCILLYISTTQKYWQSLSCNISICNSRSRNIIPILLYRNIFCLNLICSNLLSAQSCLQTLHSLSNCISSIYTSCSSFWETENNIYTIWSLFWGSYSLNSNLKIFGLFLRLIIHSSQISSTKH